MKRTLLIFGVFLVFSAHASVLEDCLNKIASQDTQWQSDLFDKSSGIFSYLKDTDPLTDEIVQNEKEKIYNLLIKKIISNCSSDIITIAKNSTRGEIPFLHDGHEYAFNFDVKKAFDYMNAQLGFIVVNNKNLSRNDVFKVTDVPKGSKFFNSSCSAQYARFNIPDDAAVNVAGQAVFTEFGGSANEFYLDYAEGDNRRAFPGLVIMDKTKSAEEAIVIYQNLPVALERFNQFGEKLKTSACANQGLALYLVSLKTTKTSRDFSGLEWASFVLLPGSHYLFSQNIEKIDSVKIIEGPFPL